MQIQITEVETIMNWSDLKKEVWVHYIATIHRENGRSEEAGKVLVGETITIE